MRVGSTRSANHTTALQRSLALGLALFALVGQLSSSAHLLLVRHAVCPEHGELIHAASGEPRRSEHAKAPDGKLALVQASADGDEFADAHGHCPIATHRRERGVPSAAAARIEAADSVRALYIPTQQQAFAFGGALLLLAPKNSPPT
jgi:hypothetical protein